MASSNPPEKDGFDFLEFPCDYSFKVMCKTCDAAQADVMQLVIDNVGEPRLLNTRVKLSRTAKYESITLKVRLTSRQELETIYEAFSSCPSVIMTL